MKNYQDGKVTGLKIAYIGGGSRGWAWGLMSDLAMEESMQGQVALYDIDFEASENNVKIASKINQLPEIKSKWEYAAVSTLEEALIGADFVVISILPGTFDEMEWDVHAPEAYKIYQSVGDTTGPGGILRALRTVPMFMGFAENIRKYCPDAWVINYTNPMTLCVRTLYEVFPGIKAFGCCHEVFGTQELLAQVVKDQLGLEKVSRNEIRVNVLGVNHFTWFDQASYQGTDLFPLYDRFIEKSFATGLQTGGTDHWMNQFFGSRHQVKFDLFKRYGVIAAAGDRHLAEFCPGKWYLESPETVKSWGFELTTVKWRKEQLLARLSDSAAYISGEKPVEIRKTGEEGVHQMKALLGLASFVTNVNIPNKGQQKELPEGAVVETNASFERDCVRPVMAGEVPVSIRPLVSRISCNQEALLKAIFQQDRRQVLNVFLNDPLVTCSMSEAKELYRTMVDRTSGYLGGWEQI